MSHPENARVTDAIAKNVGIRWCSTCQSDKPAEGFRKQGCRWICAGCQAQRKQLIPSRTLSSTKRGI